MSACSKLAPVVGVPSEIPVYNLRISSGNNQTGNINGTLPQSLVVLVTDNLTGQIATNVPVSWSVVSGGGHFVSQYNYSSPIGEAPAQLALGPATGINTVTATLNSGLSVTFSEKGVIGTASSSTSSIVGSSPIEPDGINASAITITLKDSTSNPIVGTVPTFTATGSANTYGACSASDASGVSTCTLKSTTTETKILSITSPLNLVGGTVVFAPGPVSAAFSNIVGTGPVIANGVSTSTITVTLRDSSNIAVAGVVPTFSATNSGVANTYGTCSSSNASGVSTCTLKSTFAEIKTLAVTSPVSVSGGTVNFVAGPASAANCTLTGSGPTVNDGVASSTISVSLKDAYANPVSGVTPTFLASGTSNTYGVCSYSSTAGLSTCSLKSTTAETKTLSLTAPTSFTGGTVVFAPGPVSAANSSIVGSGPVIADGIATSAITITLKDASNVVVSGIVPTFSATDTGVKNNYSACSASNASGVSTCTLSSTKAEAKILTLVSPVNKVGNTVSFNPGPPSGLTSTITGAGSVVANGVSTSSITITMKDANSNFIAGVTPAFSATDTGVTNAYGGCSLTNASGVSTCTLSSTKAEVKNISITTPVSAAGGTVTFISGPAALTYSAITGSGPVTPDGVSTSTISITLKDAYNNSVTSTVPTFSATNSGSGNTYGACSSSSSSGASTCTLASTVAETKTLSLLTPVAMTGGIVSFAAGAASGVNSSIAGTGPVTANGSASSSVTITLKDSSNIAIVGTVPTFTATNTGNGNTYGACSATNASGISTCSLSSLKAEVKTLSIASPINKAGGTVTFTAGPPVAPNSLITGSGPVVANGVATSSVTVVLYDANNNPVAGTVPSFAATNTNGSNVYGSCSASAGTGSSTCTLSSTTAEVKTLSIATPVSVTGGTVTFSAGAVASTYSAISGTGPVAADGTSASTITISLKDANNNAVSGTTPTFSATNTSSTNVYGTCTSSSASGISNCSLTSTFAETKTLSIATPFVKSGGTVSFIAGAAVAVNSAITGTSSVIANGSLTSTITIVLKDASNIAVVGTVPTFSATNSGNGNTYGSCSATDSTGTSSCLLSSTKAEVKTLSIATPVVKSGGSVTFIAGAPASANSSISGTGPVPANGTATSTITIVLYDLNNNPVSGTTPSFSATDTGSTNIPTACSVSNASGTSTCTLASSTVEVKTLSISAPVVKAGGTVNFYSIAASALTSTITGSGPVNADGTASSTVTITLKDGGNTPIVGTTPTFSATNTGSLNTYSACSASDAAGVSTCTLKSTKAEVKTLSIVTPVAMSGGSVTFNPVVNSTNSSIVGTGPIPADGVTMLTVTVTLKDYSNTGVAGVTPTFNATNTGALNTYGACTSTNASGVATCILKSTQAETKMLNLVSPVALAGSSVVFSQAAAVANSTITGTGPTLANGSATSTISITLRDYTNGAIAGVTPTFSATNTGGTNAYGPCSATSAAGVSTCTLSSGTAETKTLQVTSPITFTGGTAQFL